ncbi:MAG: FISUMP domain-containing protein [Bacteroidales bacterium]
MKSSNVLFCLALIPCLTIHGQVITLKFTALNGSLNVPTDSISLHNITLGGDTLLYWPDTTMVMGNVGIFPSVANSDKEFSMAVGTNNHINGEYTVNMVVPQADKVTIQAIDIMGRHRILFSQTLFAGHHSFQFSAGREKFIILSGTWRSHSYTKKLMNVNSGHGSLPQLTYTGKIAELHEPKSTTSTNTFIFIPGNQLLMTAYRNGYGIGITASPTSSQTFPYQFGMNISCPGIPSFTYGGQIYNTVQIGSQCWMKENLNIGIMVTSVVNTGSHSDCSNNGIIEKYCYNNDSANCSIYGGLYDWSEMMQYITTPGVQGICPPGWHLPTDSEWCTLTIYLDASVDCGNYGWSGTNAGGMLKETGTTHWSSPNTGATNESGFTALGAGARTLYGGFSTLANYGDFWTSSQESSTRGINRHMYYNYSTVNRNNYLKENGFSVRCIKN